MDPSDLHLVQESGRIQRLVRARTQTPRWSLDLPKHGLTIFSRPHRNPQVVSVRFTWDFARDLRLLESEDLSPRFERHATRASGRRTKPMLTWRPVGHGSGWFADIGLCLKPFKLASESSGMLNSTDETSIRLLVYRPEACLSHRYHELGDAGSGGEEVARILDRRSRHGNL